MRWRHTGSSDDSARAVRFAGTVSFLATLTLIAVLAMAKSAQALTVAAPAGKLAVPALPAPEADEGEGEEGESGSEECEEGEEEECEEGGGSEAPSECLLSSAEATIFATANRDRLRLQVRYSTTTPSSVAVEYGLHGGKGALFLGDKRERFAKQGVLRLVRHLTDSQMAKVVAAKDFIVRLHVLAAPSYCHPFFDRQLTVRRATPSGLAWSQAE